MSDTYTVVAPGRVNIIGEHVDHQNYPVLPCAINRSTKIEVARFPRDDTSHPALEVTHANPQRYPPLVCQDFSDIKVKERTHWTNYVLAAHFGFSEYFQNGRKRDDVGQGLDVSKGYPQEWIDKPASPTSPLMYRYKLHVDGDVPVAAGLSSSSSLVVACAISFQSGLDVKVVADLCAQAERYSGTAGGGMDQASICLSEADSAQFIHFHPLETESVKIPNEFVMVIGNTGRVAAKAEGADKMYNKRVFALKCATYAILNKYGKAPKPEEYSGFLALGLRDVIKQVGSTEEKMLKEKDTILDKDVYTKADIEALVPKEFIMFLLRVRCGQGVWDRNDDFRLRQAVHHVLTENARVCEFVSICKKEVVPGKPTDEATLKKLGSLLNESHASLANDFECSCPELDELTDLCRKAGAYGSRLTGAGWGGCTISLVKKGTEDAFIARITKEYYEPYITGAKKANPPLQALPTSMDPKALNEVLFATPSCAPARKL